MTVIETEANRLNALIDATAQIWLDFQQTHPVPCEGAIDGAMIAACARIEALTAENERLRGALRNIRALATKRQNVWGPDGCLTDIECFAIAALAGESHDQ